MARDRPDSRSGANGDQRQDPRDARFNVSPSPRPAGARTAAANTGLSWFRRLRESSRDDQSSSGQPEASQSRGREEQRRPSRRETRRADEEEEELALLEARQQLRRGPRDPSRDHHLAGAEAALEGRRHIEGERRTSERAAMTPDQLETARRREWEGVNMTQYEYRQNRDSGSWRPRASAPRSDGVDRGRRSRTPPPQRSGGSNSDDLGRWRRSETPPPSALSTIMDLEAFPVPPSGAPRPAASNSNGAMYPRQPPTAPRPGGSQSVDVPLPSRPPPPRPPRSRLISRYEQHLAESGRIGFNGGDGRSGAVAGPSRAAADSSSSGREWEGRLEQVVSRPSRAGAAPTRPVRERDGGSDADASGSSRDHRERNGGSSSSPTGAVVAGSSRSAGARLSVSQQEMRFSDVFPAGTDEERSTPERPARRPRPRAGPGL